jgi:transposase
MFVDRIGLKLGPGRIFGLDISHKRASVTVFHPNENVEQYDISLDKEGLACFLQQLRPDDTVVFENTGNCWYLYQKMKPLVREVAVADARKLKLITASNDKDDRNDSYKLAILKAVGYLPTVWMPDPQTQGDREFLHYRMTLLERQTQAKNQLRALLAHHGVAIESSDVKTKDAQLFLMQVSAALPLPTQQCVAALLRELNSYDEQLRGVDAQLVVRAQRWEPLLGTLLTIPGVGVFLAFAILAVIGDIDRFRRAKSLGNYTGDVPAHHISADKSWSGGITKAGPKLLRWALTEAAQALVRSDGYFRNKYQRLKRGQSKRHGLAITACARDLAEVIWRMLKTGRPFEECVPKGRLRRDPSVAQQDRRNHQQDRKQKRELAKLQAARATTAQQPAPIEVVRQNLARIVEVACRPDWQTSPTPSPARPARPSATAGVAQGLTMTN